MKKLELTREKYVDYILAVAGKTAAEKDYITRLDAATGDGDHWINMNAGFSSLVKIEPGLRAEPFPELFMTIAKTIMSGVGGSSGILYATAYMKASAVVGDVPFIDGAKLLAILDAELHGIMQRGGGEPGFKTMIDPLYQAVEAMRAAMPEGDAAALEAMRTGAKAGMEATRDMPAVRGRACYQANKGVGHLDPGAVTMYYQLELLAETAVECLK